MDTMTAIKETDIERNPKTIMAVDDTPLMLSILRSIVIGGGYRFARAKTGKNAMNLIESNKPDLLLLRMDMSDTHGNEIAEKLREEGHGVPIIFIGDEATKESVVKAHRMGAKDYITKPFDRNKVLSKIDKQLQYAGNTG